MRLLAAVATSHRKYRDAELLLRRATSRSPAYARAWLDLCKVQLEQAKHEDAIESAEQIVKLNPEIAESHQETPSPSTGVAPSLNVCLTPISHRFPTPFKSVSA
jgi:tetratricopeptide (TPR) repeat protein